MIEKCLKSDLDEAYKAMNHLWRLGKFYMNFVKKLMQNFSRKTCFNGLHRIFNNDIEYNDEFSEIPIFFCYMEFNYSIFID